MKRLSKSLDLGHNDREVLISPDVSLPFNPTHRAGVEKFWGFRTRATQSRAVMTAVLMMNVRIRIKTEFDCGTRQVHQVGIPERSLTEVSAEQFWPCFAGDLNPGRPSLIPRLLGVVGFWLDKRAVRGALRLLKRPGRFCRSLVAQRGMRPDVIVVVSPERQFPRRMLGC